MPHPRPAHHVPELQNPYPTLGAKLHVVTGFKFASDLHLVRYKKAPTSQAIFVVSKDYVVSYRFKNVKESSADHGTRKITVPAGFLTDLSSVPEALQPIISTADLTEASVVHDFLYIAWQDLGRGAHEDDQKFADYVFKAALDASGVAKQKAGIVFLAVQNYGWPHYKGKNPPPRYVKVD